MCVSSIWRYPLVSVFAVTLLLSSAGCSKRFSDLPVFSALPIFDAENNSVGRFKTSYLAQQINAYYRGHTNGPIAVTTFVDIDNLYGSSTFGRVLTEQLISELAMLGYNVVEIRQSESLQVMFGQGEFGLSGEAQLLRAAQDVSGLIVGTYVVSPNRIYLNARLIDPSTSIVISAGSVEMEKTTEIEKMLRSSSAPPTLERIPVRHLGFNSEPLPMYWPYIPQSNFGPRKTYEELGAYGFDHDTKPNNNPKKTAKSSNNLGGVPTIARPNTENPNKAPVPSLVPNM